MAPPHFAIGKKEVEKLITSKRCHMFDRRPNKVCLQNGRQGNNLNTETMKQDIEQEKSAKAEINKDNDNPYQKVVFNNVYKKENKTMQMENWSILSDNIRYIEHDERSKTPHSSDINTLDYCQHKELCFGINPETMKSNYLDTYEGVHTDVVYTNRFDEN